MERKRENVKPFSIFQYMGSLGFRVFFLSSALFHHQVKPFHFIVIPLCETPINLLFLLAVYCISLHYEWWSWKEVVR